MADRFTYLPSIGLTIAVVWTIHELVTVRPARMALGGAAVVAVAALAIVARRQAAYWETSEALLTRTVAVTDDNWRMETALGSVLANQGRPAEAQAHFASALRVEPDDPVAHYGLGLTLDALGHPDDAVAQYRESIRLDPGFWRAHNNLGVFLLRHGELPSALHHFSEAVRLNPAARDATDNLRSTLAATGFPKDSTDGYVKGLLAWSAAIASDHDGPGGADYDSRLASALLDSREARVRGCIEKEGGEHAPFSLYIQVDASGALTAVTAMPPTPAARCVREELRTAHAPSPPFAPFHATVAIPVEG
jgi:tetratricopeptide (TPR) repeat protein